MQKKRDRPKKRGSKNTFSVRNLFRKIRLKLKSIFKPKTGKRGSSKSMLASNKSVTKVVTAICLIFVVISAVSAVGIAAGSGGGGGSSPIVKPKRITVYFENNWLWTDVGCYYWGDKHNISWPGTHMQVAGYNDGHEVYSISIPSDVEGIIFNGLKHEDPGTRDQSPDITTGIKDGACWKMDWNGLNTVAKISFNPDDFSVPILTAIIPEDWEDEKLALFYVPPVGSSGGDAVLHSVALYQEGKTLVEPEEPRIDGYRFLGWSSLSSESSGIVDWPHDRLNNPIYFAEFEQIIVDPVLTDPDNPPYFNNTINTVFYVEGIMYAWAGTNYGEFVNAPIEPTKEGYEFVGWSLGNDEFQSFPLQATESCSFHAAFVEESRIVDPVVSSEIITHDKDLTVTFTVDGNLYASAGVNRGDYLNAPLEPTREGYIFKGWGQDESQYGFKYYDFPLRIESTLNLIAVFEAVSSDPIYVDPVVTNDHYLTFDTDNTVRFIIDGAQYAVAGVNNGDYVNAPPSPTKEGFTFKGWKVSDSELDLYLSFPYQVGTNLNLNAVFVENENDEVEETSAIGIWRIGDGETADSFDYLSILESNGINFKFVSCGKTFTNIYIVENSDTEYSMYYVCNDSGATTNATIVCDIRIIDGETRFGWYDAYHVIHVNDEPTDEVKDWLSSNLEFYEPQYRSPVLFTDSSLDVPNPDEYYDHLIYFYVDGVRYAYVYANIGDYILAPTEPSKSGYVFDGWETGSEDGFVSISFPYYISYNHSGAFDAVFKNSGSTD